MRRPQGSLAARILLAHLLVIGVMAATMLVIATTVGPGVFHEHLTHTGHPVTPALVDHAEQAFHQAGGAALGAGAACGALAAAMVGALVTRRLAAALGALESAAGAVAAGDYRAPLPPPGSGREVDSLVTSFSTMAERLAHTEDARRRLLSDVAHEMRTPLSSLRVTLEAIEDGVREPDAATLAVLREQAERLERLTGDIRAVSAAEEGRLDLRRERVLLAGVVERAVAPLRATAESRGVRLVVDPLPHVMADVDADRIAQVVTNLLANALRHTPAGGRVIVTGESGERDVTVTVSDTGEGIPAEHLPHVFERFYRTDTARDRDHGGSGIGLTISAAIARAHGGSLVAASDGPGRGAAFTLRLPRA